MLAGPPLRTEGHLHGDRVLDRVTELIEESSSVKHLTLRQPGISVRLRREEPAATPGRNGAAAGS